MAHGAPNAVVECRGDSQLSAGGKEPATGPDPGRCNDLDVAAAAVALNQPRAPSRGWISFRDAARYRWLLADPASRPPCRHGVSAVDVKGRGRVRYQRFLTTESVPLRAASALRASFIVGSDLLEGARLREDAPLSGLPFWKGSRQLPSMGVVTSVLVTTAPAEPNVPKKANFGCRGLQLD